jgi:hypothetical protein
VLILEIVQRHQQTRAHSGRSVRPRIRLTQPFSENFPVNLTPSFTSGCPASTSCSNSTRKNSRCAWWTRVFGFISFPRFTDRLEWKVSGKMNNSYRTTSIYLTT